MAKTPEKTAEPTKDDQPKRVKVVNTKETNGLVGAEARPLAKDVDTWIKAGWKRA